MIGNFVKKFSRWHLDYTLRTHCDSDSVFDLVDDEEIDHVSKMVRFVRKETNRHWKRRGIQGSLIESAGFERKPLSFTCSDHVLRSYWIALSAANATKAFRNMNGYSPNAVVLGTGTGLDALAVLLTDPEATVTAYEIDRFAVKVARGHVYCFWCTRQS